MPDWRHKLHLWRGKRIVGRETESSLEEAPAIQLAGVVCNHEHHLPLVNVVVDQAGRNVERLVVLHRLELAGQEGSGAGDGHGCGWCGDRREVKGVE